MLYDVTRKNLYIRLMSEKFIDYNGMPLLHAVFEVVCYVNYYRICGISYNDVNLVLVSGFECSPLCVKLYAAKLYDVVIVTDTHEFIHNENTHRYI